MIRKAVVIVPSEEDFKTRAEAQEKAECKEVPDNAVMEMKGTAESHGSDADVNNLRLLPTTSSGDTYRSPELDFFLDILAHIERKKFY